MSTKLPKEVIDNGGFYIVMNLEDIKYWNKRFYEDNSQQMAKYLYEFNTAREQKNLLRVNTLINTRTILNDMSTIRNTYMIWCVNKDLNSSDGSVDEIINPENYIDRQDSKWFYDPGSEYDKMDENEKGSLRARLSLMTYNYLN